MSLLRPPFLIPLCPWAAALALLTQASGSLPSAFSMGMFLGLGTQCTKHQSATLRGPLGTHRKPALLLWNIHSPMCCH